MLFPLDTDYRIWAKRYGIGVGKYKCLKCGMDIITNIPFAIKGYRGLKSLDHGCGENYTRKVMTPVGKEEIDFWKGLF